MASASSPWDGIPRERRKVITECLPGGTTLTTFVDTVDDLKGGAASPPPSPPKKRIAAPAPLPPKATAKSDNRFASYKMPGHGGQKGPDMP